MILQSPAPTAESRELTDDILDNKLLVYAIWNNDNNVHVSSQLTTLRKMMEYHSKSETVAEVITKWCRSEGWIDPDVDDCFVEAIFDRETSEVRAERLCNEANEFNGRFHTFAQFGMNIIDHFSEYLPKKVDYAV